MSSEFIARQQLSLGVREALVPVGGAIWYGGVDAPAGWVNMNGQTLFSVDYPNLARWYGHAGDETFVVTNLANYIQKV